MSTFFIIAILLLGFVVTFQIAKASEYVAILRGEEKSRKQSNKINAFLLLAFLVLGLIGVYYCHEILKDRLLTESASYQGEKIDQMLYITIIITGIVFVLTQILLFWFAFKYQESESRKPYYFPHNNKLELIWTVIPAIALTVLVGFGLYYWFNITGDAPKNSLVVEITGSQFKWEIRYPGKDGVFGKKYFKEINEAESNPLGQIWDDPANHDDVVKTGEMVVVVNRPVKLVINAKDVIHDVGLVHFRMKMDAVPGTPTTMWFTPKFTTAEAKQKWGNDFVYEISCDQMCGKGHYSMRGTVTVVTQEEYDRWILSQQPQYYAAFPERNPDNVPTTATDSVKVAAVPVSNNTVSLN
jgi:cytochrome c oxidase subunit 2